MSDHRQRTNPKFGSVLISITETCPVGCAHCGLRGSPRKGEAPEESVLRWERQIFDFGIPRIILTGGEPFLRHPLLCRVIQIAKESQGESAVFTSAYWATSDERARQLLEPMKGLNTLYISTDVFHQAKIPYSYVYSAIEAALTLGIEIVLCITYKHEYESSQVKSKYRKYYNKIRFFESRVIEESNCKPSNINGFMPAKTFLTKGKCFAGTPLVDSYGNLYTCHIGKAAIHKNTLLGNSPFYLGNLEENSLEVLMGEAKNRVDYQFLRAFGAKGVASFLGDYSGLSEEIQPWGFANACDMCFKCLSSVTGQRAYLEHINHEEIRGLIDLHLSLNLGEAPLASGS